jgi:hypothetical protein
MVSLRKVLRSRALNYSMVVPVERIVPEAQLQAAVEDAFRMKSSRLGEAMLPLYAPHMRPGT